MAFSFVNRALSKRQSEGLFRQRNVIEPSAGVLINVAGSHYLNFSGNDYLGQRQHLDVMQAYIQGISEYGIGSGASPLVTGHTRAHQSLEDYLAAGLNRDAVLLFSSGVAANQAVCQVLGDQGVTLVSDKLMHASFVDSAMSHKSASFKRYKHNDMHHLAQILGKVKGDCLVATEGVFSMDGDNAKIEECIQTSQLHNAWTMIDDAHGMGVRGQNGLGTVEALNMSQQALPIVLGTFGKGIGTAGAFVAGSREFIDYLVNFAKHYVYSTSMPPALAEATLASFTSLKNGEQQAKLRDRIAHFKSLCQCAGITVMPSDSAIQPILVGDPNRALSISDGLKKLGIWVTAIRHPTVPKNQDRLRVTLSSSHQLTDIDALVDAMALVFKQHGVVHE